MSPQAFSPDDGHSQWVLAPSRFIDVRKPRRGGGWQGGAGDCRISAVSGASPFWPVEPLGSATPGCAEPAHGPLRQEVLAEH